MHDGGQPLVFVERKGVVAGLMCCACSQFVVAF